jgi:hypothetical protein
MHAYHYPGQIMHTPSVIFKFFVVRTTIYIMVETWVRIGLLLIVC